jgi:hypothetical protein
VMSQRCCLLCSLQVVMMVRMFEPLVNIVLHPCSVTRHQVFVYVRSTHTAVLVGFGCMSGLYQDVAGH